MDELAAFIHRGAYSLGPLRFLAYEGKEAWITMLDRINGYGYSSLEIIKTINFKKEKGENLAANMLEDAIRNNKLGSIKYLLEALESKPLSLALISQIGYFLTSSIIDDKIGKGSRLVLKFLVRQGFYKNSIQPGPDKEDAIGRLFDEISHNGNPDLFSFAMNLFPDYEPPFKKILLRSIRLHDLEMVKFLAKKVSSTDKEIFNYAAVSGNDNILDALIKNGFTPEKKDLAGAAKNGFYYNVFYLIPLFPHDQAINNLLVKTLIFRNLLSLLRKAEGKGYILKSRGVAESVSIENSPFILKFLLAIEFPLSYFADLFSTCQTFSGSLQKGEAPKISFSKEMVKFGSLPERDKAERAAKFYRILRIKDILSAM